ncbi:MAG: caspase family protein [Bacteroidales bacterium]|jgi:WD40 repeat protein|nr:caspase family protein [Bacteroidales bacterium]
MMRRKIFTLIVFLLISWTGYAQVPLAETYSKRGHKILCTAYSPDARYIATGGVDDRIMIWDAQTGNVIKTMDNRDWPLALKFTPDGQYLVSGGRTERVKIWDYKTGKLVKELKGHRDQILSLDISPDGNYIATGSSDRLIKLWDLKQRTFIKDLKGHRDQVTSVSFSPDGKKLASGSEDHTVREWNIPSGTEIRTIKGAHRADIRCLAYSPDGNYLASGADDKLINLWKDGKKENSLIGHKHILQHLAFSPDGRYLLSGGYDKFFILWETATGKIVYSSQRQRDKVVAVGFSPDGNRMMTADLTYDLKFWDISSLNIQAAAVAQNTLSGTEKKQEDSDKGQLYREQPEKQTETTSRETPLPAAKPKTETHPAPVIDVDQVKPVGIKPDPYRYALIIGNEDYSSYQLGLRSESNVDFAVRDAEIFRKYAIHVLGVPEENIIFLTDARAIEMHRAINKINMIANITKGKADIFFYYAGHGFPDEVTQEPYLIPVDVSGADLEFALKLNDVYTKLTEHPSLRVTVFLDACFSGGARNQGLVAARGVKIKPKENIFQGNMVVFSASSGDQSSLPYQEMKHGMFTYYLLKKLKDTGGKVTYKELSDYLKEQVAVKSILVNNKEQIPETNISVDIKDSWGNLRFHP